MQLLLIHICIIFALYILSAFATTDILRLLSGSDRSVLASACYCPKCGQPIPLKHQIPIFSYFINSGVCHSCSSPIPKTDLFLEVFLFSGMSLLTVFFRFSWTGFFLDVLLFESVKICFLIIFGIREKHFLLELGLSLIVNLTEFTLLAFLFFLPSIL